MFLFTRKNVLFNAVVCLSFGVSVAGFLYLAKAHYVCSPKSSVYCYPSIGIASAAIAGVSWSIMPNEGRVYCTLLPAGLIGFAMNVQVTALAYTEILEPLSHLHSVIMIPIEVGECFKNETLYSLNLIRKALFQEPQVDAMVGSVRDISKEYNKAEKHRNKFKEAIIGIIEWLDTTAVSCEKIKSKPYELCVRTCDNAKADCYNKGWSFLCEIVNVGNLMCKMLDFSPEFCDSFKNLVVNGLDTLRSVIMTIVNKFIRMRIGIKFSLYVSNDVEKEFLKAWDDLKRRLVDSAAKVDVWFVFMKKFVHLIGPTVIFLWPVYYIVRYRWGTLAFDNYYIADCDARREMRHVMRAELDQELILFPLTEEEREMYQVVPKWWLTKNDTAHSFWQIIKMIDIFVIAAILLIDKFLTDFIHKSYLSGVKYFKDYKGKIFNIEYNPDPRGLDRITEMMLEQIDRLQDAAEISRMIKCPKDAPVITYSYYIYILLLVLRLIHIYSSMKLPYFPSMICARFFPARHQLRMKYLRINVLLKRERERIVGFKMDRDWVGGIQKFAKYVVRGTWLPWFIRCNEPE